VRRRGRRQGWSFQIPDDLFVSNNKGLYGFTLSLRTSAGGSPPAWVRWNDTAGLLDAQFVQVDGANFSSCPAAPRQFPPIFCGAMNLSVVATDPYGARTSAPLVFQVAQSAPAVQKPIGELVAVIGKLWSFEITDTFLMHVREGSLVFSAKTSFVHTGQRLDRLPPFLQFGSSRGIKWIEGTPAWEHIGEYAIELTAADAYGWTGSHTFTVRASPVSPCCLQSTLFPLLFSPLRLHHSFPPTTTSIDRQ